MQSFTLLSKERSSVIQMANRQNFEPDKYICIYMHTSGVACRMFLFTVLLVKCIYCVVVGFAVCTIYSPFFPVVIVYIERGHKAKTKRSQYTILIMSVTRNRS